MRTETEPYEPCPWSTAPDEYGEIHPHNAGYSFARQRGICAVCEKPVKVTPVFTSASDRPVEYRLEKDRRE